MSPPSQFSVFRAGSLSTQDCGQSYIILHNLKFVETTTVCSGVDISNVQMF